jgi:hypothetical protein
MVDFSLFPAVMRPWASRRRCYKWPYYFSSSPQRKREGEILVNGFASLADHIIESTGKAVALICMEQLDETIAEQVHRRMAHPEGARRFSARHFDASQMTILLRSLDLLVTSRFHAAVLSLAAGVPQLAVHNDTRLATLYQDLGLKGRWFMDPGLTGAPGNNVSRPEFFAGIRERVDQLLKNPELQKDLLYKGYENLAGLARQNRRHLADFASRNLGIERNCGNPAKKSDQAFDDNGGVAWAA